MFTEIADLWVHPGQHEAFAGLLKEHMARLLESAPGCRGHAVLVSHESPDRFLLQIGWDKLEDHTVAFRQSPAFTEWRALIAPHLSRAPAVEHFRELVASHARATA